MIHETPFGTFEVRWGSSGLPEHFPPPAKVRGYDDLVRVETEPDHVVLPCPLYGERKRLGLYTLRSDPECLLLFSEHTTGVYAQGTLISRRGGEGGG